MNRIDRPLVAISCRALSAPPPADQAGLETTSVILVEQFFAAWNSGNGPCRLALLSEDVIHEPSSGIIRAGKHFFAEYLEGIFNLYWERVGDLVLTSLTEGRRIQADYRLERMWIGYCPAETLPTDKVAFRCRAMFEVSGDKIVSVRENRCFDDSGP